MLSKITFHDLLLRIKSLDKNIQAAFICDADGMPIEEIGLFENFEREEAFIFTSSSVQMDDTLLHISNSIEMPLFTSLLAESADCKFLIFNAEPFVLGVITKPKARIGLIRRIVMELLKSTDTDRL